MQAFLTARRTKAGQADAFRRQWASGKRPKGMRDAYLLEEAQDPREPLGIGLWDRPEQVLAYRASDAAKQREKQLHSLVDKTRWQRPFAAFRAADIKVGGSKLPLLLLLLLAAAGAGVVFVLKRRGQGQAGEPARQQPPPVSGDAPPAEATTGPMPASYSDGVNAGMAPSAGAVPSPEGYPRQG